MAFLSGESKVGMPADADGQNVLTCILSSYCELDFSGIKTRFKVYARPGKPVAVKIACFVAGGNPGIPHIHSIHVGVKDQSMHRAFFSARPASAPVCRQRDPAAAGLSLDPAAVIGQAPSDTV